MIGTLDFTASLGIIFDVQFPCKEYRKRCLLTAAWWQVCDYTPITSPTTTVVLDRAMLGIRLRT
eukprot:scaffold288953_cov20-Prasinocladus_malaysianus.AAC.1